MGWAIGKGAGGRDIGYGVLAICDQPGCDEEIDRGVSFACGSFRAEAGCGHYFCGKHLYYFDSEDEEDSYNDGCEFCDHCLYFLENPNARHDDPKAPPYHEPKPDTLKWVVWKMLAPSWEKWREVEPREVKKALAVLDTHTITAIADMAASLKEDLENDL